MGVTAWTLLALAGGVGAVARFGVSRLPLGTLVANATGAFALGLLVGAGAGATTTRVVGTGFLGGYTTVSTWMVETAQQDRRRAALSLAAGLALGLAGVAAGRAIARG